MWRRVVLAALAVAPMAPGSVPGAVEEFIKAEVRGTLRFEAGHGYYISVHSKAEPERETRVWLRISENKVLVRQLQGLMGKHVRAEGNLEQMPDDVQASVPARGLYLLQFQIEEASDKAK
jgi:hypothetical protein